MTIQPIINNLRKKIQKTIDARGYKQAFKIIILKRLIKSVRQKGRNVQPYISTYKKQIKWIFLS